MNTGSSIYELTCLRIGYSSSDSSSWNSWGSMMKWEYGQGYPPFHSLVILKKFGSIWSLQGSTGEAKNKLSMLVGYLIIFATAIFSNTVFAGSHPILLPIFIKYFLNLFVSSLSFNSSFSFLPQSSKFTYCKSMCTFAWKIYLALSFVQ